MRVKAAKGVVAEFNDAGVLEAADVHVSLRWGRLASESSEDVLLAAALAVRAVRLGSVCVDLHRLREVNGEDLEVDALPLSCSPPRRPPLTRELPYTAITRAREHVRVIGTEESVRAGVQWQVLRASALRRMFLPSSPAE